MQVAMRSYVAKARSRCWRTYCQLAGRILVLVLLGFAATDFVITMTLSAADAARHATENPYLHPILRARAHHRTLVLLLLLSAGISERFRRSD